MFLQRLMRRLRIQLGTLSRDAEKATEHQNSTSKHEGGRRCAVKPCWALEDRIQRHCQRHLH